MAGPSPHYIHDFLRIRRGRAGAAAFPARHQSCRRAWRYCCQVRNLSPSLMKRNLKSRRRKTHPQREVCDRCNRLVQMLAGLVAKMTWRSLQYLWTTSCPCLRCQPHPLPTGYVVARWALLADGARLMEQTGAGRAEDGSVLSCFQRLVSQYAVR